jgi:CDP-diacylglycerol--glycerol-3-phosphate 3-phosphatidyltransferase
VRQPQSNLWAALNWPNRISLLRILAVPPFVVLLLNQQDWPWARHAAMALFVAVGLSDALDGFLARHLGQITRLGRLLDPLADKLLITCAVILLATRRASSPGSELHNAVVVSVVGKDVLVVIGFFVLFMVTGEVKGHPTLPGKLCTIMQIVLVAGALVAPDLDRLSDRLGHKLVVALSLAVVALCILAAASYVRMGLAVLAQHEAQSRQIKTGK